MPTASKEDARRVKSAALTAARDIVPIAGVGVTKIGNAYAVKVNLAEEPPDRSALPKSIDGVGIIYEVVGEITKLDKIIGSGSRLSPITSFKVRKPFGSLL